ncbi:MAG TPA: gamma-glutamyltransferase [Gemmatimonadales bacterium]|nr:gamma-glutamyltransferase [Gemmatimonadales bacterium]
MPDARQLDPPRRPRAGATRLRSVVAPALLLAALFPLAARAQDSAAAPAPWRYAQVEPAVVARHGMAAADHPVSSQVGAEILRRGGNAIDAIVAVAFAHAVVEPAAGNLGGGGFLVYRRRDGRSFALDFRETAPAAATRDMFVDSAGRVTDASWLGPLSVGVPGSVAGLWEMHRRFGRLPWRDVVAPAVALARDGHVVDQPRADMLRDDQRLLERYESTARLWLPGGRPYQAGDTLRQPELAATLQLIADSGARVFYRGRIAGLIVAEMRRDGGLITAEDLDRYRPRWRTALRGRYRGHEIITMPPASSGGATLIQALNILAGFRLGPFGSVRERHLLIEAERRAFLDRNTLLGDPAFVTMPLRRLTSPAYAARQRRSIRRDRATPTGGPALREGPHTTNYSVVDARGNAACLTTTLNHGFGSKIVVGGAGFFLNNEMDDFTAQPGAVNTMGLQQLGQANAVAPGKRPLSSMTPTIVLDRRGRLELVLGSEGGAMIITAVLETIVNVVDHRMTLAEAVAAPRVHHNALPDSVATEPDGLPPDVRAQLEAMGHHFYAHPWYFATVTAVRVGRGGLEGVADPRLPSRAAGY